MRRVLALATLLLAVAAAPACNVGPQPLPPGATDTNDPATGGLGQDSGFGGADYADAGAAAPSAESDASRDFGLDGGPTDASSDAATDDAASDGGTDAGALGGDR
jgi:hypothetical protein